MTETPSDVPARPDYVLRVRKEANGVQSAWLDDQQVFVPPGVGVHKALINAARRRADREHPGDTIRVAGVTTDGATFHLAIGPDGTAWEVEAPQGASARGRAADEVAGTGREAAPAAGPVNAFRPVEPAVADEPETPPAGLPALDPQQATRLTDDLGRPIPVTTTHVTAHPEYDEAPHADNEPGEATAPPAEDGTGRQSGPSRRSLLLGGAGVVALAGVGAFAFLSSRGGNTPQPTPAPTGTPLPDGIRPPAGLPASYVWSVVNLSDVAPQVVVTDKQLVCTVDNDTTGGIQLLSLDASTGKTQWKADLPVDAIVAEGPALCAVDGSNSIVLTTQTQIIAYPVTGGEPKTWPLQQGWTTALNGSGVIVTKPTAKGSALVLHGDRLAERAVPSGGNPVALLPDGTLVVTDMHGHAWLVKDARKTQKPRQLAAPAGTTPGTYIAATATQLITAFVPKNDTKSSRLRSFSLPTLRPRVTTEPITPAVFPSSFMMAPDGAWAVGSNTWVDLATGASHVITGHWSPIAISQHNSWSKSGDNILTANAQGKSLGAATGSGGQVTVPRGGTAQLAYCVASVGSDTTLYAVPLPT